MKDLRLGRYGVLLASVLSCAVLAAACGDNETPDDDMAGDGDGGGGDDDGGGPGDDGGPDGDAAADAANQRGVTLGMELADLATADLGGQTACVIRARMGAILLALDEGEILQAEVALERGAEAPARELATRMRDEHAAHAAQVRDLLVLCQVAPLENAVSAALRAAATAGVEALRNARPEQLGFAYVELQVEMHAAGEVLLDRLLELAPDERFLDFIQATRDAVAQHREQADSLLRGTW